MDLNRKCYVYRFVDINNKYMYVGETNNIDRRIGEHLQLKSSKFKKDTLKEIQKIEYIKVDNKMIARQFEIHYINKYRPYLNISDKFKTVSFEENEYYERKWKTYRVLREPKLQLTPIQNRIAMLVPYAAFICILILYFM